MSISRVAHGTVSKVASGDLSPGAPAGSASGDGWLCYATAIGATGLSMSGDWVEVYDETNSGFRAAAFFHAYTGAAPDLTVTSDGTIGLAVIVAYESDAAAVALDDAATDPSTGNSATIDYPSVTPEGADEMCVFGWHVGFDGTNGQISGTDPTPTEQLDDSHASGLTRAALGYADGVRTAGTATGARTSTHTSGIANLGSTILLKEDAGASAAVTGTATDTIDEADVRAGGKTIIITLTDATWLPA